jgi:hypothetical protein
MVKSIFLLFDMFARLPFFFFYIDDSLSFKVSNTVQHLYTVN